MPTMEPWSGLSAVLDPPREARFSSLFEAHYGAVHAYVRRRAPADVAADVTASTFEVLWNRIDEPVREPLPWLYGVARRLLANARRGDQRRLRLVDRVTGRAGDEAVAPDPADAALDIAAARVALGQLRDDDREVLMLVAWDGLDPAAAAASLGISTNAFAVRLHRARRRLEDVLDPPSPKGTP